MWRLGLDWKFTTKYWLNRWKYDVNRTSKMNIIKTVITCFHNTRKWCWCSDYSWVTQRWKAKSFSHLGVKLRRKNTIWWTRWLFHKTEKLGSKRVFFTVYTSRLVIIYHNKLQPIECKGCTGNNPMCLLIKQDRAT